MSLAQSSTVAAICNSDITEETISAVVYASTPTLGHSEGDSECSFADPVAELPRYSTNSGRCNGRMVPVPSLSPRSPSETSSSSSSPCSSVLDAFLSAVPPESELPLSIAEVQSSVALDRSRLEEERLTRQLQLGLRDSSCAARNNYASSQMQHPRDQEQPSQLCGGSSNRAASPIVCSSKSPSFRQRAGSRRSSPAAGSSERMMFGNPVVVEAAGSRCQRHRSPSPSLASQTHIARVGPPYALHVAIRQVTEQCVHEVRRGGGASAFRCRGESGSSVGSRGGGGGGGLWGGNRRQSSPVRASLRYGGSGGLLPRR